MVETSRWRGRWWVWVIALALVGIALAWIFGRPTLTQVQTTVVSRQTLQNKVFASGTVRPVRRQIIMPTELTVPFSKFTVPMGASVHRGDIILLTQNSAQSAAVSAAQVALSAASSTLTQAQSQYKSAPPGLQPDLLGAVNNARISLAQAQAQLAQARAALDATIVRAQFDGVVVLEDPSPLSLDATPSPLMEVVSRGKQIVLNVSQVDAAHMRAGLSATLTSDAYPNQTWNGRIQRVASFASTTDPTAAAQVELDLTVPSGFPVPYGYQVNVNIVSATRHSVPVVPYDALVQNGDAYAVDVVRGGRVYTVPVTLGVTSDTVVEVRGGVRVGQVVVVNPPPTLTTGQAVSVRD